MRKLFTSSFSPNDRLMMVRQCAERMLAGQSFLYLTPSRESMFEVRSQLMEVAGSLFNGHVWGFDDLVKAILKGHYRREDVIGRHEISVLVQSVLRKMPVPHPYDEVLEKPGFIKGVCKAIADLKRAGVTVSNLMEKVQAIVDLDRARVPESSLKEMVPTLPDSLHDGDSAKEKLEFLANVFSAYQMRMEEGGWLDTEDLPLLALDHISTAECLSRNTLLVIDGFQRLDASRHKLLKSITEAWPNMDMMANVPYWDPHLPDKAMGVKIPFADPQRPDVIRDGILADLIGLGFEHSEPTAVMSVSSTVRSESKAVLNESKTHISETTAPMSNPIAPSLKSLYQAFTPTSFTQTTFSPTISSMVGHPCRDHELRETARSIMHLISEHGVAPQQIAIFCPDAESYRHQLNEVFAEMGIPLDSPHPVPLHGIPLVRDLMALLLLRMDDQYGASMKNLVASKYLVPLPLLQTMGYETDKLRQAAMQCDALANPEQWDNRFIAELKKMGLFQSNIQEWLDSLHSFHPEKTDDPSSAVHILLEQLERYDPESHISNMAKQGILSAELLLRDMKALATFHVFLAKTASIWERLIDRDFNDYGSPAAIQGDDPVTKASADVMPYGGGTDWYPRMVRDLQTLLEATDIGYISTDHAGVRYLSPEMAGGQSYHTVYLPGMNEGVFPRPVSPPILFTERETALLRRCGIPLPDPEMERLHGQVLFRAVLATARNGLHLSWCTATEDGALMNTSPFVDDVADRISAELLPVLRPKPISMRNRVAAMPWVRTGYPLIAVAMEMEREYSPYRGAFDGLLKNPLLAQQETDFSFSPSQLNSYAYCPFTYFTERVLGLTKEDDEPLNAMNIGTFYHDVLRAYHDRTDNASASASDNASSNTSSNSSYKTTFNTISKASSNSSYIASSATSGIPLGNPAEKFDSQRLESIFEELVEKLDFSQLPPITAVFRKSALLKTLTRFLQLDAANLSRFREATGNRLIPILLEQPFEMSFGADIRLKGFVDRVDLEVDVHHRFTGRYILYDYKKKGLKELKDIVMGDDFQLPLYRTALQSMLKERFGLKKPECLALLYFSIEKLEWKGIIRSDVKTALFEPKKRPQVLSEENMDVLLEWVEDEAGGVVSRIRDGDFRLPLTCPAKVRQYDCQYTAICRHDEVRMARKSGMTAKLDEVRMACKSGMMAKLDEVRMARKSGMMAKLEGQ